MIKKSSVLVAALALVSIIPGCVTTNKYTFNNVAYSNKLEALQAENSYHANLSSLVRPLPSPLVEKTLLVSIPTKESVINDITLREAKKGRDTASMAAKDRIDYVAQTAYDAYKYEYVTIKNSNIYKHTELTEGSYSSVPQPNSSTDVLCIYSSGEGTPVTYLVNTKNGKQILSFDVSLPDGSPRVESMLNSIKVFALQ
jgi:hypothetical protein